MGPINFRVTMSQLVWAGRKKSSQKLVQKADLYILIIASSLRWIRSEESSLPQSQFPHGEPETKSERREFGTSLRDHGWPD